jgi:hypothetical protein
MLSSVAPTIRGEAQNAERLFVFIRVPSCPFVGNFRLGDGKKLSTICEEVIG